MSRRGRTTKSTINIRYGRLQILLLLIPALNLDGIRRQAYAHEVALVPDVIGVHKYVVTELAAYGQMVVIALLEYEMNLSIQHAIFLMVKEFHLIEINGGAHLVAL